MDWLNDWFGGRLAATTRIWGAAGPALAIVALMLGAYCVYCVRNRLHGDFRDEEMDHRGLGGATPARMRHFAAWLVRPLWRALAALEGPPNALTTLSLAMALAAAVALAAGRFSVGGWLYLASGALDLLDGRVARETGRATRSGAALDSVMDRYCESAVLLGLAWYYRHSWVLAVCLLAVTGSLLVPYVRARGEGLGLQLKDVGIFQRAERIVLLGLTVALSPIPEAILVPTDPAPPHRVAIAGLVVLAIATHITAAQRLWHLVRNLDGVAKPRAAGGPRLLEVIAIGTAADCLSAHLLLASAGLSPLLATAAGSAIGASTSLAIVFAYSIAGNAPHGVQPKRFLFVCATSAALHAGGVAQLLHLPVSFPVAWIVSRLVIMATWTHPLSYGFVVPPRSPGRQVERDEAQSISGQGTRHASRA